MYSSPSLSSPWWYWREFDVDRSEACPNLLPRFHNPQVPNSSLCTALLMVQPSFPISGCRLRVDCLYLLRPFPQKTALVLRFSGFCSGFPTCRKIPEPKSLQCPLPLAISNAQSLGGHRLRLAVPDLLEGGRTNENLNTSIKNRRKSRIWCNG